MMMSFLERVSASFPVRVFTEGVLQLRLGSLAGPAGTDLLSS